MNRLTTLAGILFSASLAMAQPSVDIYLLDVERSDDGAVSLGEPRNATQREGYDNQPSFLPDGSGFYFTSIHEDQQADVYRFDFGSNTVSRVTDTPESEYSPTPMPNVDRFSCVRVEMDSTQRLWSLAPDGTDARVVLPNVRGIGYHAWADENHLGLFVLGDPHELHRVTVAQGESVAVVGDIGRSLQPHPDETAVTFVRNREEGPMLCLMDPARGEVTDLIRIPEGAQDHAWTPWAPREIWMTSNTVLWAWTPGTSEWVQIADVAGQGLSHVTRLALSPDGSTVALVAADSGP